jgi:hypothetical protein
VITEWRRFLELNLDELRDAMRPRQGGRILIDGRNLFDPAEMQRLGFRYRGIGRGAERRNGNGNGHSNNKVQNGHVKGRDAATAVRARATRRARAAE